MARTAKPKPPVTKAADNTIITVKVTLRDIKPPIWRRLLLPASMTLGDLHVAIQSAMGWHDDHLHMFEIGGDRYGDPATTDDIADEARKTLISLLRAGVARFDYTYDFGDSWEHAIIFEKSEPAAEGATYPACIGGKRNCPPEDCGGSPGYERLLEILADPDDRDYEDQVEWVGGAFDPEAFDLEAANRMLTKRLRRGG